MQIGSHDVYCTWYALCFSQLLITIGLQHLHISITMYISQRKISYKTNPFNFDLAYYKYVLINNFGEKRARLSAQE